MKSIQKNNDNLVQSQLTWRYDKTHKWSTSSRLSSFQFKEAVPRDQGEVQPKGALRKKFVGARMFQYLENEWTVRDYDFRDFREKYRTYVRRCRRAKKAFVPFRDWEPPGGRTPEQKRYTSFEIYCLLYVYKNNCCKFNFICSI